MKKTIYAVYALICVFALCGEYSTENMNEFFLYYSFWFINAVIAAVKFNKAQQ